MVMRKLDETELEMAEKGKENIEKEVNDIKEQIDINTKTIEFQEKQYEYEDYIKPINRKTKRLENKKVMNYLYEDLKRKEDTLKSLKDQIKNGVEIKEVE